MTQDLLVATRGGIGDHIISSGLINHLTSETYNFRKANVICYEQWEASLTYLYEDNPRVNILAGQQPLYLGPEHEKHHTKLAEKMGLKPYSISTKDADLKRYQEFFYKSCGHPFEIRYKNFQLPKRIPANEQILNLKPEKPYALIFCWDKFSNGPIKNFKFDTVDSSLEQVLLTPKKSANLFDWLPLIFEADEIHASPGGPFHLIDSVLDRCKTKKFYYHNARVQTIFNPNNKFNNEIWQVVQYDKKVAA